MLELAIQPWATHRLILLPSAPNLLSACALGGHLIYQSGCFHESGANRSLAAAITVG